MMCFSRGFGSMQTWDHCRVALQMSHLCPTYVPPMSHLCPTYVPHMSHKSETGKACQECSPPQKNSEKATDFNLFTATETATPVPWVQLQFFLISHLSHNSEYFIILYHQISPINLHTAKTCCDVGKPARVTLRCLHTSVSIFSTPTRLAIAWGWSFYGKWSYQSVWLSSIFHCCSMLFLWQVVSECFRALTLWWVGCLHLAKQESSVNCNLFEGGNA